MKYRTGVHPGGPSGAVGAAVFALALAASASVRAGQPLLAVETFDAAWRIVRDSHFDRAMNGVDWNAVAAELRPRAEAARSVDDLRAVVRAMLARLGQSHFTIIPAGAGGTDDEARDLGGSPGFDVRLVGRDLLVTRVEAGSPAADAGVRTGWILRRAGAASFEPLLARLLDTLEPRLRQLEAWRLADSRIRGPAGSRLAAVFEDEAGRSVERVLLRRREAGEPVTVGNLPPMFVRVAAREAATPRGRRVGVVRFNVWMAAVDGPFGRAIDEFRRHDGIVLDLRGNPGGLAAMLMGISGHFIDDRKALGVMKTRDNELRFMVNPRRVNPRGERVQPYGGPVAILVDGLTGSASECFTGGMQALGRARVFGQQTMGQALPALFSALPNGDVLIHAYGDFVTADGTRLEGRGVVPDETVPVERDHLLAGRDRPLEAALAWIDGAAAPGSGGQ